MSKPVSHKVAAYDAGNLEAARLIALEPGYPDGSARHQVAKITLARLVGSVDHAETKENR